MGTGEHVFLKTWEWEDMREDKGLSKREHEVWVGLRPTLVACCIFGMSVKKQSVKQRPVWMCGSLLDRLE